MEINCPQLVPQPREIRSGDQSVELPKEVELVVGGLASGKVGVVEEILSEVGVRVENGAAFVVELGLGEGADGEEAYELKLDAGRVRIVGGGERGILWGTHVLADLYRAAALGKEIPELEIRDCPDMPHRGIFVEDKWGPDRMVKEDWFKVVDRLAANRMNSLGIGLYGCWGNCRNEVGPKGLGWPTEFLMVPVAGHPELKSEKHLRWFSPADGEWHDEIYLPPIFAEDFLGDIVDYGKERGVTVIPFVNSLGHNTMIPRLLPEVSAKDEEGKPLSLGYCLSNPETRGFIEEFYGGVIDRYYSGEAEFFHIQMDEVWADNSDPDDPTVRPEPWCQCPDCRKREREENLQDYIIWLVEMLTRRGAKKVVMWNDQLTRHMDALDESFVGRLEEKGLADRLILHWWWYNNQELNDRTRVAIGKTLGLPGWVAPMTCYFNWQMYSPRLENIQLMMEMAHEEGGEGAVPYSVHDPGWADHEMLLASYAWNHAAVGKWEEQVERWAEGRFGEKGGAFLEAIAALREAAAAPALSRCYHYTYTYCREGLPFPRAYPGEALEGLGKAEGAKGQLVGGEEKGRKAAAGFSVLAKACEGEDRVILNSLLGEAVRIEGLAGAFVVLLEIWKSAEGGDVSGEMAERCGKTREKLVEVMEVIEKSKPHWVVPATLHALSALLEFMDQLSADLGEVGTGERKPGEIRWTVERGAPS